MARTISANETDYWLIPKRINVHQAWCLIDGIIERGYDGRSWNPNTQNNLGASLKKWGATSSGKNISPQAIRTLTAYVQYLGFVYVDNTTTPSTIRITKAGKLFWKNNRQYVTKLRNLNIDAGLSLKEAEEVKTQMEKLLITNPILQKKCTNILLFPFRITLQLLRELEYLDVQELAMYVFSMKDFTEYNYVIHQIKRFRHLSVNDREELVSSFKESKLGNIALVKAPSTRYYASLCESTGLITATTEKPLNVTKEIVTIRIIKGMENYVDDILTNKYANAKEYDFKDDLRLWIDYYGDPDKLSPPTETTLTNTSDERVLVSVYDPNNILVNNRILNPKESTCFPAFANSTYEITLYNIAAGKHLQPITFTPSESNYIYSIQASANTYSVPVTADSISQSILEHLDAKYFNSETTALLQAIKEESGVDRLTDLSLRGAFLESEFFKLLTILKNDSIIDDVIWHGKYGAMGLPVSAPGGKNGICDLKFIIDDTTFVLELTTMKSKTQQEKAEASSVPDHVRIEAARTSNKVKGIFAAPLLHDRVVTMMKATAASTGTHLACIKIEALLDILKERDKEQLKALLENLD